jgi:hypothetical protein
MFACPVQGDTYLNGSLDYDDVRLCCTEPFVTIDPN